MKLEKLTPQEKCLTREEMLCLHGGSAAPTLTGTLPHSTDLGASTAQDYDDADGD
ncbi:MULTISPECIES: hypothetical protein [unclassified Chitinophaga]|uniref:hypothetical protein n=1 Tax=unclassified Chitinophaga TaxID=2619133 RepID=UPI0015C3565B|nr:MULTISPECIES: hypothetical protein [unclassified Chitinophaga]WPV67020.1 hypothetical protein QQL36_35085 [Chitinophaga sp. LS1]